MEASRIELRTLFMALAAVVGMEMAASVVIAKSGYNPLIVIGAARVLEICSVLFMVGTWGSGVTTLGLHPSRFVPGLKRGLLWSAGFGMVALLASVVVLLAGANPLALIRVQLPAQEFERVLFFAIGGLVAPVAEEVFFRGILYGFFRRWGVFVGVILSTLIFVLCHNIVSGVSLPQVVGGAVFALAYEIEKSLVVPIIIHVLGNLAIFTLSLIC